jgi:CRP-like cAMP-binding protein
MTNGELYGHHEVLHNEPVPYTAHATAESQIILLSREDVKALMKESSALREYATLDVRKRCLVDRESQVSGTSRL